jgi:hypothetical protein
MKGLTEPEGGTIEDENQSLQGKGLEFLPGVSCNPAASTRR